MTLVKQGLACGRPNCIYSKKKRNWNNKMTRDMLQLVVSQNKIREQFQLKLSCSLHR